MVTVVKTKAKVVCDNTGFDREFPVLLTEGGVLDPVLDYLIFHDERSESWMERVVHATYLLIQYMNANEDCFDNPQQLFRLFASRLYAGTIGDDGVDPSGLYWLPASTKTVNGLILALTALTDWLADQLGAQLMNPLRPADSYERRLNYAAWFRRNQNDFLGHIRDKRVNPTVNKARTLRGRRAPVSVHDDASSFPEPLIERFFLEGIGGAPDRRVAVRNQLILLMMHYAGCRESDSLHLWVHDVLDDPHDTGSAIVRLYHPEDGRAPDRWQGRTGATNRAAYLRERYALTPRNRLRGTRRVGWKYSIVDHKDNYIQLHWFPPEAGILFAKLWREYCLYLAHVKRDHPYAFISFSKGSFGAPFTLNSFNDAYRKALLRIGETPTKAEGRSPHAHRHAMGRRLEKANVDPTVIKKVLHHRQLSSQVPYTVPGITRTSQELSRARTLIEANAENGESRLPVPDWGELMRHGFEEVDPEGLLSGASPELRRRRS